jgi:hypothetical protein
LAIIGNDPLVKGHDFFRSDKCQEFSAHRAVDVVESHKVAAFKRLLNVWDNVLVKAQVAPAHHDVPANVLLDKAASVRDRLAPHFIEGVLAEAPSVIGQNAR